GAVMRVLPKEMAAAKNSPPCVVLAPYFKHITDLDALKAKGRINTYATRLSFCFAVRGRPHRVEVTEVTGASGVTTFLLAAEHFFTAPRNPYMTPCDPTRPLDPYRNPNNPARLTEDALFFCTAVPIALAELRKEKALPSSSLILHLQDWETACVAPALRQVPTAPAFSSIRCVLTLHNPYDRYLSPAESPVVADLITHLGLRSDNVLAQTLPLVGKTLSTVSRNFAEELRRDPLHTHVFAPHLQKPLAQKTLVGIDNGLFGTKTFPFSRKARRDAEKTPSDFRTLQQEKRQRRLALADALDAEHRDPAATKEQAGESETWGAALELTDPAMPVFLIPGRDDPRQKGFDVVAEAIRHIPTGRARYVFTPMPGDEGLVGLRFLQDLAEERPGEVKVFPFRLPPETFRALQRGSSFMVMASLYEPFGAATEAYLAGMPVVARATGGLAQQVAPYRKDRYLSLHGQWLAARYHHRDQKPTGFLFREHALRSHDEVQGWRHIAACGYWHQNPKGDRIADRTGTLLFDAMVKSAAQALQDAIDLYSSDQRGYAEMIYNGFRLLERFSWKRTIRHYRRLLYTSP
ncbi:MAG: glycogen/starch synthase, partial [Rhodothermales bacterium]